MTSDVTPLDDACDFLTGILESLDRGDLPRTLPTAAVLASDPREMPVAEALGLLSPRSRHAASAIVRDLRACGTLAELRVRCDELLRAMEEWS